MLFINHKEIYDGNTVLIEVKGPLNTVTSPDFEYYINQLLEKHKSYIILDARQIEYVSSEGIGVMIYIQKKLSSQNGYFVICNLPTEIKVLYRLLGFDRVLTIANSSDEAVKIMEKQMEIRESFPAGDEEPPAMHAEEKPGSGRPAPAVRNEPEQALSNIAVEADDSPGFENPLIVECAHCRELIRVKRSGTYECPHCHTEFSVEKDQTIVF